MLERERDIERNDVYKRTPHQNTHLGRRYRRDPALETELYVT